jgi:hypothetical protein
MAFPEDAAAPRLLSLRKITVRAGP